MGKALKKVEEIESSEKGKWVSDKIWGKVPLHWTLDEMEGLEIGRDKFYRDQVLWLSNYDPEFALVNGLAYELVNSQKLFWDSGLWDSILERYPLTPYFVNNKYCPFCHHTPTGLESIHGEEFRKADQPHFNLLRFKCYVQIGDYPEIRVQQKNRRTGQVTYK